MRQSESLRSIHGIPCSNSMSFHKISHAPTVLTIAIVVLSAWEHLQYTDAQTTNHINVQDTDTTRDEILAELRTLKDTCSKQEKCASNHSTDVTSARCNCEADCPIYGDCCRDAFFFKPEDTSASLFACVSETEGRFSHYMVAKCPKNADPIERRLCEKPEPSSDPVANNLPVTVPSSKGLTTYLNAHCAKCNTAELSSAQVWTPKVMCYDHGHDHVQLDDPRDALKWNVTTGRWTVMKKDRPVHYDCKIEFRVPDNLDNLRMCRNEGFVDKCLPNWRGTHEERMCQSYTAFVVAGSKSYRNIFCAKCNNDEAKVDCIDVSWRTIVPQTTFWTLLKVSDADRAECRANEIFDSIFRKCRSLVCPAGRKDCGVEEPNSSNVSKIEGCSKVALESGTFELSKDNRSVRVVQYNRSFSAGEFLVNKFGLIEICIEDVPEKSDRYSQVMGIVTVVGLSLSIFFLVLHLCAVALVAELRNHSGMNLSSLCVALLGAYISFIVGSFLSGTPSRSCSTVAVLTYYFFMSAFFWMLVIAFDVWRVLRGAVRYLQTSSGRQYCRFITYSSFAWGVPAMLTITAILVETAAPGTVNDRFRPHFGKESCWFSRQLSLAVFFATPLAVIMALNVIFFVSSAFMASTSRLSSSPSSNVSGHQRDFRLYLRLAILLGLTWVVGLFAALLDYEPLWICFVLFNTLQGLFIFAVFTCTSKVLNSLSKPHPWVNRLRNSLKIPSFKPTNIPPGSDVNFSHSTSETTLKSSSNNTSLEMSSQVRTSPSPSRKFSTHLQVTGLPRKSSS